MIENVQYAYQLAGFLFVCFCTAVGGYIVLRWGWCGVVLLWQRRHELDIEVRTEAEATWKQRRGP